jgi:hypothetical protein
MRIWPPLAVLLLAMHAVPALAERDPNSGAPLPPKKRATPSPITDHFYVRVSYFSAQARTHLRVDPTDAPPGTIGTPVSGENDLGLPGRLKEGRVEFMFRMRERNKVRMDYFEANRTGSKVLANDVVFGNETFAAGQLAQSSLDWQMFDITYTYSLIHNDRFEAGTGLGLYMLQVNASGAVPALFQQQQVSAAGPFPALPADLVWRISSRFALTARAAYLRAALNGFRGWFEDTHADAQYRWGPNFAIGLGYSSVRTSLNKQGGNFPGQFGMAISGPEAFVRFSF